MISFEQAAELMQDSAKLELLADLYDLADDKRKASPELRTVQADLRRIAALLHKVESGEALLIVKENGEWPKWALTVVYYEANDMEGQERRILDGLAVGIDVLPAYMRDSL